jgi:hypothetical protein
MNLGVVPLRHGALSLARSAGPRGWGVGCEGAADHGLWRAACLCGIPYDPLGEVLRALNGSAAPSHPTPHPRGPAEILHARMIGSPR